MQKLIFLIKKNKLLSNKTNKLSNIKKRKLLSTNVLSVSCLFGINNCFELNIQKETSKVQKKNFFIKSTNKSIDNFNIFWNCAFDKGRLKSFVVWFLNTYGEYKTIELLEQLKNLGFGYATKAGVSLGIDDLKIPSQKFDLINQAESKIFKGIEKYKKGQITGVERLQQLIDVWNQTSEFLKQEVIRNFETTDLFNPVYMMAFSGARGNISQVRQLVGMRGLMSDPQGNIIDFPIQSNFREGLTLTEYIISTYGARKGIVDTALRTATAGYLTRRLVDVAQHVMISQFDCGTTRGIFLFDMKEGAKTIYSFQNRLIGRVLANDIECNHHTSFRIFGIASSASLVFGSAEGAEELKEPKRAEVGEATSSSRIYEKDDSKIDNSKIIMNQKFTKEKKNQRFTKENKESSVTFKKAYRNQEISSSLAASIAKITKKAFVRSPLTCETRKLVCQLCYGWSLASSKLVSLGEAVGVIAAQSIGEPGTQLTMRTFHTGGVFSGGLNNQIIAPYDGYVEYSDTIPGTCIRTPQGDISFLTKTQGSFFIKEKDFLLQKNGNKLFRSEFYTIPAYAILFFRNKQQVFKKQIVAQFSSIAQNQAQRGNSEQTVYAELEGEISFSQIDLLEQQNEKLFEDIVLKAIDWSKIWILSGKIYYDPLGLNSFGINGDFFNRNTTFQKIYWHNSNSCFLNIPLTKQKNKNLIFKGIKRFSLTKTCKQSLQAKDREDFFYKTCKQSLQALVVGEAKKVYFGNRRLSVWLCHNRKSQKKERIINSTNKKLEQLANKVYFGNRRLSAISDCRKRQKKENILNINIENFNLNREKFIFLKKIPKNFYIKGFKNKLILFLNKKFLYYFYIDFKLVNKLYKQKKENSISLNNKKIKKATKKLSYFFLMNTPFDIIKFLNKKTSLNNKVQQKFEIFSKSKIVFSKFYNNKNARFFKNSSKMKQSEQLQLNKIKKMNPFQFEKIIKNNYLKNFKNMSYSKINLYKNNSKKENSFYDLKFVGINKIHNINKVEDDLKKSIIEKQKKKKIAKKISLYNKTHFFKTKNRVSLKILLKNKPNSLYNYPFRTFIQFFLFKKINRIHFISYYMKNYMKKTLKSSVKKKKKLKSLLTDLNTKKQKNVKKLMNPFILKNSIPNFLKKKTIRKRIFSTIPESSNSLCEIYNFKKVQKTDMQNYSVPLQSLIGFGIFNSKLASLRALALASSASPVPRSEGISLESSSHQSEMLRVWNRRFQKEEPNPRAKGAEEPYRSEDKQATAPIQNFNMKNNHQRKAKNINSPKLNDFYKRKPILTLPVNKISFKKFGYIFSINKKQNKNNKSYTNCLKSKIKSDLILSYFPLTNSYNTPIYSSNMNNPGKNFQKLSLGNTLNLSRFPNIAFRWFPSDSQTISNGIYIWSRNFLINERTIEKDIKTYNKVYRENPDFYINNFYFVQKKRWIHLNGLFKKYNKKEIFNFNKYIHKLSQNMKNKNFLYKNDYSFGKFLFNSILCFAFLASFDNRICRFASFGIASSALLVPRSEGIFLESLSRLRLRLSYKDNSEITDSEMLRVWNRKFQKEEPNPRAEGAEEPKELKQAENAKKRSETKQLKESKSKKIYSFLNKRLRSDLKKNSILEKTKQSLQIYEKYGKKSYNFKFRYDLTLKQKLKIFVTKKYVKKLFFFNQSTFKDIEDILKIKTSFFNYITKFSKFSVYTQDFYYIPQENSKFNILNITEHKFGTQFSPKFYLSNRQGFKKSLSSEVSGLTRIYTQIQDKNLKTKFIIFDNQKLSTQRLMNNKNFRKILINKDSIDQELVNKVYFGNQRLSVWLRHNRKRQKKEFLISCLSNKNLKNNFLISKKFSKKTIYPQNNKKHKNLHSSIKIKNASYNMNLNIRNKMSSNIFKKILKKQKNTNIQKNENIKKIKCSQFYKDYNFNKNLSNTSLLHLIAQLNNQPCFFSCIPFISYKQAKIDQKQKEKVNKEKQKFYKIKLANKVCKQKQKQTFKMKHKSFISTSQVERIKKPGWVYFLIDSYNSYNSYNQDLTNKNEFISLNSQSKGDSSVLKSRFLKKFSEKLKIKNFLSFKILHQTFVNEGRKVIHDIYFEQNKIYIENVTLSLNSSFIFRELKNKEIKISKLYTNNNCRFFDGFVSTMLFNEKNEKILNPEGFASPAKSSSECLSSRSLQLFQVQNEGKVNQKFTKEKKKKESKHEIYSNNLALLFRPIQHKILPNPQLFKKEISNNQKNSYNNYSILFYKDYHSNLLNLQNCHKKSLSKFPSVDFQIRQVSQNINLYSLIHARYRSIKDRSYNNYNNKYNKKDTIIKKKLKNNIQTKTLNKMQNYKSFLTLSNKTSVKLKKQSYDKKISFYMKKNSMYNKPYYFSNIYFSAYKINSFSLELKNTKPLGLDFGFNIPTIILKPSYSNVIKQQNLNFLTCKQSLLLRSATSEIIGNLRLPKEPKERNYLIPKLANAKLKPSLNEQKKENNLSQMFYYLMKKNMLRKLWISKTVQNFSVDSYNNWLRNFGVFCVCLASPPAMQSIQLRQSPNHQSPNQQSLNQQSPNRQSPIAEAEDEAKDEVEDNSKIPKAKKNTVKPKKQRKIANLNSFFAFFYLYPFPFIEWSLTRKDDYLANSLLSSNKKIQNIKNCLFPNSYYKNFFINNTKFQNFKNSILNYKQSGILNQHTINMQSFSFAFPLIKNSFLLYKAYNKILANQVYATTNLLSPFEGELLTQNKNNKWWNQSSETDLTHKKLDIKHYIFLTKKDMFSISLDLNSNANIRKYIQQNKKMDINEYLSLFSTLYSNYNNLFNKNLKQQTQKKLFDKLKTSTLNTLNVHFNKYLSTQVFRKKKYNILNFVTKYQNKIYKLKGLSIGKVSENKVLNLYLGKFLLRGDNISFDQKIDKTGQIIHLSSKKITLRYAQPFLISPKGILHVQQGDYVYRNAPIITLPFETLTTGDIVQGIPKVEQYLEARTTQNGRFFLYSLPVLQKAIFERYRTKLPLEQAVAQSFLKIQQIIVDGVQRVYRSQGVSIAEKHLEVIVKQMTSKVQIIHGGQTGFFPGELVDLEIIESVNKFLMVKIRYEPIVLGITRASLEVESFLSAASFQQTTKILAKASLSKKKDYLKGLKENLLVGNLIPAGTGFMNSY
uniref:DNA-directed RNA polymerase subunit beta'' n=1 Tax=Pseudopediastrum sp. CL0201VA TaxID=2184484 RepID=A0A2U8GJL1_9CHLO|nr:RNA polymerase beta subunit [Pseudopediastrum sp. CL0201VA]AWI68852.1 RNA polymerase beta subunit [Pseudopediastrum sp. CL0201VA]